MDFVYYVIRKKDMIVLDGAKDIVGAINIANNQNCACLIMQGCVITEIGQDISIENNEDDISESEEIIFDEDEVIEIDEEN